MENEERIDLTIDSNDNENKGWMTQEEKGSALSQFLESILLNQLKSDPKSKNNKDKEKQLQGIIFL